MSHGSEAVRRAQGGGARGSGVRGTQHPQMAAARDLHRVSRPPAVLSTGLGRTPLRTGRFPYGIGERLEIVTAGPGRGGAVGEPDDLPAARGGQALTVLGAQVIAMRLGVGGERAEDRSRIGIDVRQCRDGRAAACGARTATYRAHDVGRYRTLERAATTLHQVTPPCRAVTSAIATPPATALTCTEREARGRRPPVIRSRLGANEINHDEIGDRGEVCNRAQAWPECSISDKPSRPARTLDRRAAGRATLRQ